MTQQVTVQKIVAIPISEFNFTPYGQVISASADGKPFDQSDAQLKLEQGIPRFYIMRLEHRGRIFHQITRHNKCTQCLGSLEGKEWFMAVCPPSADPEPDLKQIRVFRIPGTCFIKLKVGTWHAGPYFDYATVDFYNLELSDTNVVDHFTHNFVSRQQRRFEIVD